MAGLTTWNIVCAEPFGPPVNGRVQPPPLDEVTETMPDAGSSPAFTTTIGVGQLGVVQMPVGGALTVSTGPRFCSGVGGAAGAEST